MPGNPHLSAAPGRDLLGVVLAGGGSRRFGGTKALHPLAGRPMAAWALESLKHWTAGQAVVSHDPEVAGTLEVPGRPDRIPGQGPLGGLHTALAWAREEGMDGVFLLACDLPLVRPGLVERILRRWPPGSMAVVPGSHGPLGCEPLCAAYDVGGLPVLEELLREGHRTMEGALSALGAHIIPPQELGSPEEVSLAFTNVNTVEEARVAERSLPGITHLTLQQAPAERATP